MTSEIYKTIESESIRRQWDKEKNIWYFSVVDVIGIVTSSTDARNYWKVLKNRLNKANPELVTRCNQLKMPSSDGKSYLTDVADSETILEIIRAISIPYVAPFRRWFNDIESQSSPKNEYEEETEKAELTIDAYETDKDIILESMVAGVSIENLSISITLSEVIISGKRLIPENISHLDYVIQEIYWGAFSRTIPLPSEIDIDEAQASIEHGLLKIKLPKINKLRTRIIKIKSLG
jgi:HSP20 family molecular chaperone IbpA